MPKLKVNRQKLLRWHDGTPQNPKRFVTRPGFKRVENDLSHQRSVELIGISDVKHHVASIIEAEQEDIELLILLTSCTMLPVYPIQTSSPPHNSVVGVFSDPAKLSTGERHLERKDETKTTAVKMTENATSIGRAWRHHPDVTRVQQASSERHRSFVESE